MERHQLYHTDKKKGHLNQITCMILMTKQFLTIMTAGSAGGLFCPYKGLLPAASQDALN
jgi:hypothetical protein